MSICIALGSSPKDIGKVHGKADLAADSGARDILAAEYAKCDCKAVANGVLASREKLQLASS